MVLDTPLLTAVIGGSVTIAIIIANRFRCLCSKSDCKIGITENSIMPTGETELKISRINGHDVLYVSKNGDISDEEDFDNSEYGYEYDYFTRCLS